MATVADYNRPPTAAGPGSQSASRGAPSPSGTDGPRRSFSSRWFQVYSGALAHAMSSAHRLIVVGSSRIGFAAIERLMDGAGGAHTAALPSEQVLRWVAGVVGGIRVVSIENAS